MLAAAAVVVAGYGVGSVLAQGSLSGSEDSQSASDTAGGSSDLGSEALGSSAESGSGGDDGAVEDKARQPDPTIDGVQGEASALPAFVRLRSDRLDDDVRRALGVLSLRTGRSALDYDSAADRCPPPPLAKGERSLSVRYDGRRAVLVAAPEEDGLVEVTVYSCSGAELADTSVAP